MLNQVSFIGYVGKDAEVRYLTSGEAVANFSVASTRKWKGKDGEQHEHTEWLRCQAWGKLAEICGEYVRKGRPVFVQGELQTREYTDKDGATQRITEARLQTMRLLGGREDDDGERERPAARPAAARPAARPAPAPAPVRPVGQHGFEDMDDDIPF